MKPWTVVALTVLLIGAPAGGLAEAPFAISSVVVVGERTPIGGTFVKFEDRPMIGDAGAIVFVARVEGGTAPRGVFLASKDGIVKIVAEGDPTPIGGTFGGITLGRPSPTKQGRVVFMATVNGGAAPEAVFLFSNGTIRKVVAQGDPTPLGGTFANLGERPSVNDNEVVALSVESIVGGPVKSGTFLFSGGQVTKVAVGGDPMPGGGRFDKVSGRAIVNARGSVLFGSSLRGGPVPAASFVAVGGVITPLVRVGDLVPDTGGGRVMRIKDADLSDRDEVSFRAFLDGGTVAEGFFVASPRGVVKVAGTGDVMPPGERFEGAVGRPSPNSRGAVSFLARLKSGIASFVASDTGLTRVVSQGDPSPVGGTFGDLIIADLGESGDVVFRASVVAGRVSEGVFVARRP